MRYRVRYNVDHHVARFGNVPQFGPDPDPGGELTPHGRLFGFNNDGFVMEATGPEQAARVVAERLRCDPATVLITADPDGPFTHTLDCRWVCEFTPSNDLAEGPPDPRSVSPAWQAWQAGEPWVRDQDPPHPVYGWASPPLTEGDERALYLGRWAVDPDTLEVPGGDDLGLTIEP